MTVSAHCPCGLSLELADEFCGRKVHCAHCGAAILVPSKPGTSKRSGSLKRQRTKSESGTGFLMSPLIAIGAAVGLLLVIGAGFAGFAAYKAITNGSLNGAASDVAQIPSATSVNPDVRSLSAADWSGFEFPSRPMFEPLFTSGISIGRVKLNGTGPAQQTQMNVYLPDGMHSEKSLGCVLVAPAGTNLLIGNSLDGADYHDETLPYAEAGFAVVQYSLDGSVPDLQSASNSQLSAAYQQFKSAEAGILNTRSVIEFIKARMPEVDPARIFTAGHSSAGTVSLLAAENFSELAGCIAYAPCSDVEAFHAEFSRLPGIETVFPNMQAFDRKSSPVVHVSKLACPTFVFQARDDQIVQASKTQRFVALAKQNNKNVEYIEVAGGGHYQSMIDEGIPQAVKWLVQQNINR